MDIIPLILDFIFPDEKSAEILTSDSPHLFFTQMPLYLGLNI